ncbi:MAG: nucleotide sugar dehydrogenase [Methanomassiliicoccales archaeon]|nr:MAG: nucleotide sugar dehydrogenase [Methanomassiliicoccales archaeon]
MGIKEEILDKIKGKKARICVVGLGYVGLPTAVFFGEQGFEVIGADVDEEKVQLIKYGKSPQPELMLENRIEKLLSSEKLHVIPDVTMAVEQSDVVLIIVPTPVNRMKKPDLSFIVSAGEDTAKGLKPGKLVVLESTTFPGTCEEILQPILEKSGLKAGEDFGLAYCPERYNPGDENHTLDKVARIVGAIDLEWAEITKELYQSIVKEEVKIVKDLKTAEAAKVIENIQRDLNIALFNELAMIFQKMDIDVISVIEAASTKWNFVRYYPGPGVGGHCLPVDPYYLTHKAMELGYHPQLILAGRSINDNMPFYVVDLIIDGLNELAKPIKGSKIAILGVAYKANTSDIRETPAKAIVKTLLGMGANVCVHDPLVDEQEVERVFNLENCTLEEALRNSDCVVLHTYHKTFQKLQITDLKGLMKDEALLVDTQHMFSPNDVVKSGLKYRGIGRGGIKDH